MAKIYLAARYDRREEMERIANLLKEDGHTITAQWVYGNEEGKTLVDVAVMDYMDVKRADTVIQFTDPVGFSATGGGRHTEFGLGYAWGKVMILCGPREQVFHHLPDVYQYDTLEQVRKALRPVPKYEEMQTYDSFF